MSRLRTAVLTAALACGLVLAPTAANAAQTTTPLTQKLAVTGSKSFKGTYTIDRFIAKGGKLYSVGTLTGKAKGIKKFTKTNVRFPATVGTGAQKAQLPPIPGACNVLNLVLGPIDLNLLGLRVRTNQINLRIDAVPGPGNLLGNLLCGITNALNPGTTPLSQLAQILTALTALSPPNPA